jgi:hypothetical protein
MRPLGRRGRVRWELAVGVAAVALLTLAFFAPMLAGKTLSNVPSVMRLFAPWAHGGKAPFYIQSDQATYVFPYTVLETHAWRAGTIPLWNPFSLGGIPLLANGQAGVVYPLRILLSLLVAPAANHDIFVVTHVFASGVFMFIFIKELRLHLLAAVLGAVAWMFASFNTTFMQLETILPIIAWLPLALLLIHRGARTRSWRVSAAAGIPLGLMALGGNLEFVAFSFAVCGLYSASLVLIPPGDGRPKAAFDARRLIHPVLTFGIGTALGAVTLLPTVLNANQGGRDPTSYAEFVQTHTISTGEFAHVFSDVTPSLGVFVGVVTVCLAFVGLCRRRAGAALGRWLALGTFLFAIGAPVITWLIFHLVPGASRLSSTWYVLFLFDLGVVILGALGLDAVLKWSGRALQRFREQRPSLPGSVALVAPLVAVLALGVTAWQLLDHARSVNPPFTERSQPLYPVTPALAAVQRDVHRRDAAEPQRLIGFNALFGEQSAVFPFEDADGYDSVAARRVRDLWRTVSGSTRAAILAGGPLAAFHYSGSFWTEFSAAQTRYALLPRLGVTTIIASPQEAELVKTNPGMVAPLQLTPIYEGNDASVFDIRGDQPRGWVVHEADVVRSGTAALHRYADPDFDYRNRMIVEPDQGLGPSGRALHRGSGPGTIANRDPIALNGTAFTVNTQSPGWLVMADAYAPGWDVTVNGRDAKLLRANYMLRAVRIPAGRSRIVLKYHPPGFVAGLVITALAVVALLAIGGFTLAQRRRRRRPTRSSDDQPTGATGDGGSKSDGSSFSTSFSRAANDSSLSTGTDASSSGSSGKPERSTHDVHPA